MTKKKSLYEILEVANDATYPEIRASFERLLQSLACRQSALNRENYNTQLRLLKVAQNTLSTPTSRDAYDAHLLLCHEAAKPQSLALTATAPADPGTAALRAEALLMRADAMALRADAMGLKADLISGQPERHVGIGERPAVSSALKSLRAVLMTLGTLVALSMVVKLVFLFSMNRQPEAAASARNPNEDKVFLQDYYQTWGVRPASRAEAELMDAERRKNESATRAQHQMDDAQRRAEQAEHRFEEESRRRGDQVSAELQYAQERAQRAAQLEDERIEEEKRRKAEAERDHVEAERARFEAERAKWQNVIRN